MTQRKHFCPRLLDYVILVGSRHPNRNNTVVQTPELLRRYPLEDHSDFALPPDVVFFCQPEGCVSMGPKKTSLRESTSFVFTLTEKDSGRMRYGVCFNFYRPFARRSRFKPECRESTKSSGSSNSDRSTTGSSSVASKEIGRVHSEDGMTIDSTRGGRASAKIRNNTLTSLCIISHHPFLSKFRECLITLRKLIDACNQRACGRKIGGPKGNFRDTVWGVLTSLGTDNTPLSILKEVREVETWILKLLSSPVPVPGKTRVELSILPQEIYPPLTFALPDHTRFSLVDFPLHLPLELLGVDTCLKVLSGIILEQKIIMQSRDYNALSMSVIAFVAMLFPLEYMFPVIPLLPTCMNSAEQLLLAPTPYIIGVPASFLMYKKDFKLPDDIWIVDLDSNKVYQSEKAETLPHLPEQEVSILKNHLKQALASMSMSPEPVKNLDDFYEKDTDSWSRKNSFNSSTGFNPFIYGNDVDSVDVATRVAMVRFFNSPNILGNFAEHTRTLRLYPRPVVAFQQHTFLKSRPALTQFTKWLAMTQAVEYYGEWLLCPQNVVHMRVQTGVFDPSLIGDKQKWYSHTLQPVVFNVCEPNSTIGAAILSSRETTSDDNPTDESAGSGSDWEDSNSSSYSSLSDFVTDITNSSIDGNTLETVTAELLTVDKNVFRPPSELQVPDPLVAPDSSGDSDSDSSASSSPCYASDVEDKHMGEDSGAVSQSTSTSRASRDSAVGLSVESPVKDTVRTDNISSNGATTPISPTTSDKDVNAVMQEYRKKRPPPLHIVKVDSKNESTQKATTPGTPGSKCSTPNSAKSENDGTKTSTPRTPSSIISSLGSEISEKAHSASSTLSEIFGNKPPPRPPPPPVAKTRQYAPLGSRRSALVDRSGLVKHTSTRKITKADRQQQAVMDQRTATHSENQQFLKDTINQILEGRGIGWLKASKVRRLMEDENYRNFVVSRLNTSLDKKLKDEDKYIQHVSVSKSTFKGMLAMLKAIIHGLEQTYQNHGLGGMASALMVLEIAHTHYWQKEITTTKSENGSQASSPFGSRESLSSINDSPRTEFRTAPGDNYVITGNAVVFNGDEFTNLELRKNSSTASLKSLDEVVDIRDHDNNLTHTTEINRNIQTIISADQNSNRQTMTVNKASDTNKQTCDIILTSESDGADDVPHVKHGQGDMLREMVNNKYSSKKHGALTLQGVSVESDVSDASTLIGESGPPWSRPRISHHSIRNKSPETESYAGNVKQHNNVKAGLGPKLSSESHLSLGSALYNPGGRKCYLYQALTGKDRSVLWDKMQFWEDTFLDAIAQERDIIGMDQGPGEMIDRYISLSETDRRRLEHDEDKLLSYTLYNLAGFMVMMNVNKTETKKKVRRLLGKSHIGLYHSQEVNLLLDQLHILEPCEIQLKPLGSRLMQKQSFTVHWGADNTGDMLFMEVCDDCIVLRSVMGVIHDRWWYEKLVKMTYCPKTKVLCLWRKEREETQLNKFYTKKCKELYFCVKESMEKAALNNNGQVPGPELGGEFPVQDMKTGQGGLLQVCMEGIGLLLANSKFFIELNRIKKCYTQKGGVFVLEEYDAQNRKVIQRKYKSSMADQICYAVLCLFSYTAASTEQDQKGGIKW